MLPNESSQTDFYDLEIRISRGRSKLEQQQGWNWFTSFFWNPTTKDTYRVEIRMPSEERHFAYLTDPPIKTLRNQPDPREYGMQLFRWLLQGDLGGDLGDAFRQVRWAAEKAICGVRLRLSLDPNCPELQSLRWETMRDPVRDEPISLTMAFSRFMYVPGPLTSPIRERPLRLLLATSNPQSLDRLDLSDIDVELGNKLVKGAIGRLGPLVQVDRLGPTTKLAEVETAAARGYHIVHLFCHAALHGGEGYLLLADDRGAVQEVSCDKMVTALTKRPPYLVFLATSLSRPGEQESAVFLKLASMLIQAGVQAVVTIQGPMATDLFRLFVERFYGVLIQTGVVDQAMADARVVIYKLDGWDWANPILYTRIPDAQIFQKTVDMFEGLLSGISVTKS